MIAPRWPARPTDSVPRTGPITALVAGGVILGLGLLSNRSLMLPWFIPSIDLAAVICLIGVAALGGLDASLRHDTRSLPVVGISVAAGILWLTHFVTFPGSIPGITGAFPNEVTSWTFEITNLAVPIMVAVTLLQRARPLPEPRHGLLLAALGGLIAAAILLSIALGLAAIPLRTTTGGGEFRWTASAAGVLGLIPAIGAYALFLNGRRGDPRIASGVLAALVFCGWTSLALLFIRPRFTAEWYAVHILAFLPYAALLAGQLSLYGDSVRAEQAAHSAADAVAARLRTGFELAVDMATQTDLALLIRRLVEGSLEIAGAERATLIQVEGAEIIVESSVDRGGLAAPLGIRNPITAVTSEGRPIVLDMVRERRAVVADGYTVEGVEPQFGAALQHLRHTLLLPLEFRNEVIAALVLSRRDDPPFVVEDAERLREFTVISALLLRNARLLESAQDAATAKGRFLNMAAHELRTPLSVIKGYLDLLVADTFGEVPATQRPAIQVVAEKAAELGEHVERLLIASRLEANMTGSPATEVDLAAVAADAVRRSEPRADLVRAVIDFAVPDHPVRVQADAGDLALILDNLLNNALTYSRPPPAIGVELRDGGAPELRVTDNGIGIPPDQHERIFEQFHRVENEDFGYPPGTGLGLFIARRLAARHGAELVLESSSPDTGSVFLLRFPVAASLD